MGTRLLCCVALCLLGAGSSDAQVTQIPGHLVIGKGQRAKMDCFPPKEYPVVYWYQQTQNKEFKFLIYFQNEVLFDQTELAKERFSAQCSPGSWCSLEIPASEPGDSALYFCASGQCTALRRQLCFVHKLILGPAREAAAPRLRQKLTGVGFRPSGT